MGQGSRPERVADQIRAEVTTMIARELHDPGVGFVTVTRVEVSPDLQHARVYYTSLGDAAARKNSARALERATGFMRRQIGRRLHLRRAPEIHFEFDESIGHQDRVEQLLKEIADEHAAAPVAPDAPNAPERSPTLMTAEPVAAIRDAILQRQRFVVTSHARPDGDAIGSQVAMAYALRQLGKVVQMVDADAAPPQFQNFPGVRDIHVSPTVDGPFDAAIVMECGDLERTGVEGFDKYFVINIDHHPGNRNFGAINWFDPGAAACGEMVFDVIEALGVRLTPEIATHIYIAILTDTGGFHFSHITPRTFDICRRCTQAGAEPEAIARAVYDSSTMGRLRLMGAVLHNLEFEGGGRAALAALTLALLQEAGATYEDADGLINIPLTVKEIQAVALFKEIAPDSFRISLRSKGDVDVNRVAHVFGGGGHKNAAGCTLNGPYLEVRGRLLAELKRVLRAD